MCAIFLSLAFLCLFSGCELGTVRTVTNQAISMTDTVMGTIVHMTVYPKEKRAKEGEEAVKALLSMVRGLEEKTLSKRLETAELSKIDQKAGKGEKTLLSSDMTALLKDCRQMTTDSEGAFDVTIGALVSLWRIDERALDASGALSDGDPADKAQEGTDKDFGKAQSVIPTKEEIEAAASRCGWEHVHLENGEIWLDEGTSLDLGSVGKGVALDRIRTSLEEAEDTPVKAGVFALGGSILIYGEKPDGSPWKVGIVDPLDPGKNIGILTLTGNFCISTSGDYERFFEVDGKRYHHILDPKTGEPSGGGIHGVTIVSESGFLSDALSTACFVLGREKGMALAKKYGAEVLFVENDNEIFMSDGMKAVFSTTGN